VTQYALRVYEIWDPRPDVRVAAVSSESANSDVWSIDTSGGVDVDIQYSEPSEYKKLTGLQKIKLLQVRGPRGEGSNKWKDHGDSHNRNGGGGGRPDGGGGGGRGRRGGGGGGRGSRGGGGHGGGNSLLGGNRGHNSSPTNDTTMSMILGQLSALKIAVAGLLQ
jgi:hypothetical protein